VGRRGHQWPARFPIDFILPLESHHPWREHHLALMANCYGQIEALLQGRDQAQCIAESLKAGLTEEQALKLAPHKEIPGNKPCNLITCKKLTPKTLGSLIALYEHKIFMQSLIWDINAFDQWGVELGKVLARPILQKLIELSKKSL
jgi:glucose-6-phosphate isomerase